MNVKFDDEKDDIQNPSERTNTKEGEVGSGPYSPDNEELVPKTKNVGDEKDDDYADEQFDDQQEELDDESIDDLVNLDDLQLESKVKQVLEKEEEESFRYSIRNKPKLMKKRDTNKQTTIEKLDGELTKLHKKDQTAGLSSENREQMRRAEKVFGMIHDYCKDSLSVGYNLLDKHIEDLLNPDSTVSPLLKYFNLLAKDTNFRLPSKSLLEFDQKYYRKFIFRLREAQKTEIQWTKNTIINESRKTVEVAFNQARKLLQAEVKSLLYDFD